MTGLIPRSLLFGDPVFSAPALSPDGRCLGHLAPDEGSQSLWVTPRAGGRGRRVTDPTDGVVRGYTFCHDDRSVLVVRDRDGDENWQLSVVDRRDGSQRTVTPPGVQARIVAHTRHHPGLVLVALNATDPALHDLYRLELGSGQLTQVAVNPGYTEWLVDAGLRVRGGSGITDDGGLRLDVDGVPGALLVPFEQAGSTAVLGFTLTGDLLVVSCRDSDRTRLFRWAPGTPAESMQPVTEEHRVADISAVWLSPIDQEPQVVEYEPQRQELTVLDPALQRPLDQLRAAVSAEMGAAEIDVDRRHRDDRWWTVTAEPADASARSGVFDAERGRLRWTAEHRPGLGAYRLAPMHSITARARDGRRLPGYLTVPAAAGADPAGLPAVLLVHGGPWERDRWGFDTQVQWLADRGYAVLQVNFRGSTGYGQEFLNAGDRQWGAAMQDDLVDALAPLVARGLVDPARVAVMGASYGGYAALHAAVTLPDLLAAAVSLVGPSDLRSLLAGFPPYWAPMLVQMHRRVGHPDTDAELLRERSPLTHADRLRVPLLLAHGRQDPRVAVAESEQLVATLHRAGVDHEFLLFDDEGHGLARPANRERFHAATEAFLARHLGGAVAVA